MLKLRQELSLLHVPTTVSVWYSVCGSWSYKIQSFEKKVGTRLETPPEVAAQWSDGGVQVSPPSLHSFTSAPLTILSWQVPVNSLKLHDEDDDDEEEVAAEASCCDTGPVRCEQQPEETQQRAERRVSSCSWGQMWVCYLI